MNVGVRLFAEEDATAVAALIRTTLLTSNAADYPREELETIAEWYSAEANRRIGRCQRIVMTWTPRPRSSARRRGAKPPGGSSCYVWQGRGS